MLWTVLQKLFAGLMAFASLFTGLMDMGTPGVTAGVELVKEDKLVLTDAMLAGQGVTTDGQYYYTAGSLTGLNIAGLAKWDAQTMEIKVKNSDAIPSNLREDYGTDHIGGISYYDGKIYAAVENDAEDYPLVITYDARTLKVLDIYEMPAEYLPDGIPWCAVDAKNGYLYCSKFKDVEVIMAVHLDTMEFSHFIPLSQPVTRIQGGEVYEDKLYLSIDNANTNDDQILSVDVFTGEVTDICTRSLPSAAGNEAEGVTVYPMADGSLYHVLDYDKTIGVYLRHYKVVEN